METHVKTTIEIDGKQLDGFKGIRISQSYRSHHSFEIVVPAEVIEGHDANNIFQGKELIGKSLKIDISPEENSKRTGQLNQFNGLVTNVGILRHGINASDFVIRGFSPTILLDDGPNTRSFAEKTISQVVNMVLKPYPKNDIRTSVSPKPDTNIAYLTQYNETNYNFLCRLAEFHGQWLYYDGTDFRFGELEDTSTEIELFMGQDLMEFELGMKIEPLKFDHISYDYMKNRNLESADSQLTVSGMNDLGKFALNQSESIFGQKPLSNVRPYFSDLDSLRDYSTHFKTNAAGDLVIAEGTSVNPKLRIGSKIKIKSAADEHSEDYGSFIVITVSHHTDMVGTYSNSFEAVPSTLITPPTANNYSLPKADIQKAIVVENDDPDNLGRVRVQFIWQEKPNMTPWIRTTTPYAGENRGFQFIPELDDEVLVCFEHNNPDRPLMMGALHHGNNGHEDRKDSDNYTKTIRTISNNEVLFLDKPDEEEIIIQNKQSKNVIRLSIKDEKILIQSENTIEIIGKDILIEAEKTLTMRSEDMKAETKKSMVLNSENSYEVKNATSKSQTSGSADIASGGAMEIKSGAGLDVSGGPKASIKAGVVMIN